MVRGEAYVSGKHTSVPQENRGIRDDFPLNSYAPLIILSLHVTFFISQLLVWSSTLLQHVMRACMVSWP
jgi:hypothetical protein